MAIHLQSLYQLVTIPPTRWLAVLNGFIASTSVGKETAYDIKQSFGKWTKTHEFARFVFADALTFSATGALVRSLPQMNIKYVGSFIASRYYYPALLVIPGMKEIVQLLNQTEIFDDHKTCRHIAETIIAGCTKIESIAAKASPFITCVGLYAARATLLTNPGSTTLAIICLVANLYMQFGSDGGNGGAGGGASKTDEATGRRRSADQGRADPIKKESKKNDLEESGKTPTITETDSTGSK